MMLNTPIGVGWLAVPVETGACTTRTPLLKTVTRWVASATLICSTPFGNSVNPSFSGFGFLTAAAGAASMKYRDRRWASAEVTEPASRVKATPEASAARSRPSRSDTVGAVPTNFAKALSGMLAGILAGQSSSEFDDSTYRISVDYA